MWKEIVLALTIGGLAVVPASARLMAVARQQVAKASVQISMAKVCPTGVVSMNLHGGRDVPEPRAHFSPVLVGMCANCLTTPLGPLPFVADR
jgi:hypothetical protein